MNWFWWVAIGIVGSNLLFLATMITIAMIRDRRRNR